ncbi:hypothetical protein ACWKSP_35715 [Micromonosporaceae bacterium Da 78-11]
MNLTGIPLILLTGAIAVLAGGATVRFWSRGGRWRLPTRTASLLVVEVTVVLGVALVANRAEAFYPSWRALRGDTGADVVTTGHAAGRLDGSLATTQSGVLWRAGGAPAWHLADPPVLIAPTGYDQRADLTFPVVLALVDADRSAPARTLAGALPDVVTVVLVPTGATTAAALTTLAAQLDRDTRVTGRGWAIVADPSHAGLARQLEALAPDRFTSLVVGSRLDTAFGTAVGRLAAPLAAPLRLPS